MKEQISRLKTEKNAVILAHYYAPSEAQEVADYISQSLALCDDEAEKYAAKQLIQSIME